MDHDIKYFHSQIRLCMVCVDMCMLCESKSLVGKLLAIQIFYKIWVHLDHALPRKNMEQCRLRSAKLQSNADFASQIHRSIILCPAKLWSNANLCFTKLQSHSFKSQHNKNLFENLLLLIFKNNFCKSLIFQIYFGPF